MVEQVELPNKYGGPPNKGRNAMVKKFSVWKPISDTMEDDKDCGLLRDSSVF